MYVQEFRGSSVFSEGLLVFFSIFLSIVCWADRVEEKIPPSINSGTIAPMEKMSSFC